MGIYFSVDLPTFYFSVFIFHKIYLSIFPVRLDPLQLHHAASVYFSTALILLLMKAGLFTQRVFS